MVHPSGAWARKPARGSSLPVGGGQGAPPDRALERRKFHTLRSFCGKNMDVVRPVQGGIQGLGRIGVVVARGNEHRAWNLPQGLRPGPGRSPGRSAARPAGRRRGAPGRPPAPGQAGPGGPGAPAAPPAAGRPGPGPGRRRGRPGGSRRREGCEAWKTPFQRESEGKTGWLTPGCPDVPPRRISGWRCRW